MYCQCEFPCIKAVDVKVEIFDGCFSVFNLYIFHIKSRNIVVFEKKEIRNNISLVDNISDCARYVYQTYLTSFMPSKIEYFILRYKQSNSGVKQSVIDKIEFKDKYHFRGPMWIAEENPSFILDGICNLDNKITVGEF